MKLLTLSISLLLLAGCTPNFQAGDCIGLSSAERWEKDKYVSKVLEVGEKKYRLEYVKPNFMRGTKDNFDYIRSVDRISEKVECPNE